MPGRSFRADSRSSSSICKAENGERPKKSLKHHNENNNPKFPCSQSRLTPPFSSSPEILFPQDCWHPQEDRSGAGVMLGVNGMGWDISFRTESSDHGLPEVFPCNLNPTFETPICFNFPAIKWGGTSLFSCLDCQLSKAEAVPSPSCSCCHDIPFNEGMSISSSQHQGQGATICL